MKRGNVSVSAISVSEAARNFSDCVNRVRYQQASFVLLKNGVPVARLAPEQDPAPEKICLGSTLAAALKRVQLSEAERTAWHDDLEAGRSMLEPPADSWR